METVENGTAFLTSGENERNSSDKLTKPIDDSEVMLDLPVHRLSSMRHFKGRLYSVERVLCLFEEVSLLSTSLSYKVESTLKLQEDRFLKQYQQHMETVAQEVKDLKKQLRVSEERVKNDTRVITLENERNWFKKEAIRLDERVVLIKHEKTLLGQELMSVKEENKWFDEELKKTKHKKKILKAELSIYVNNIKENLESQKEAEERQNANSKPIHEEKNDEKSETKSFVHQRGDALSRRQQLKKLEVMCRKAAIVTEQKREEELKTIFETCVKTVRKDVCRRKILAQLKSSKLPTVGTQQNNLTQKLLPKDKKNFADIDKKRIIQKFLMEDQVFSCLYDLMFK